jgi:hypothetical protein
MGRRRGRDAGHEVKFAKTTVSSADAGLLASAEGTVRGGHVRHTRVRPYARGRAGARP